MTAHIPMYRSVIALGLLLLWAAPAAGQDAAGSVSGRVSEIDSDDPVAGALVQLVRNGGAVSARTLTSETGGFSFDEVREGRYGLRVERIGFRGWSSPEPFPVASGEKVVRRVRLPVEPVRLPELSAVSCVSSPSDIAGLAALWDEIRKALEAQRLTREEAGLAFRLRETRKVVRHRDGTGAGRAVLESHSQTRTAVTSLPYMSAPPAQLSADGYAHVREDSLVFFGPDARSLLSPSFREDHCFHAAAPDSAPNPGWIGLAFEPAPGRSQPDVAGTLWVDRETAELRSLSFRYVNLPGGIEDPALGGDVSFERLGSGRWIVREWTLRVPHLSPRDVELMEAIGWMPGKEGHFHVEVKERDQQTGEVVTRAGPASTYDVVVESGRVVGVEKR